MALWYSIKDLNHINTQRKNIPGIEQMFGKVNASKKQESEEQLELEVGDNGNEGREVIRFHMPRVLVDHISG